MNYQDGIHDLVIKWGDTTVVIPKVDEDCYFFLDLIRDFFGAIKLSPCTSFFTCENGQPVRSDADIVDMFAIYKDRKEINLSASITPIALNMPLPGSPPHPTDSDYYFVPGSPVREYDAATEPTVPRNRTKPVNTEAEEVTNENDFMDGEEYFYFSRSDDKDFESPLEISSDSDDNQDGMAAEWEDDFQAEESDDNLSNYSEGHVHDDGEFVNSEDEFVEVDSEDGRNCGIRKKYADYIKQYGGFEWKDEGDTAFEFRENQTFANVDAFRDALRDYSIQSGYKIKRIKNDKVRVTAICEGQGCSWRIHASILDDNRTFMIKTIKNGHSCVREGCNRNANARWIARKLNYLLRADPDLSHEAMQAQLTVKFGIQVKDYQLYRAKVHARRKNEGIHAESYAELKPYADILLKTNPGSVVKFEFEPRLDFNQPPVFKRCFICLHAMKMGFLKGCRPFFGLDGCHLKGPFGGILLVAVAVDGNKGIFPIAFGVVEQECKDSWSFFLNCLNDCIGYEINGPLSIMSDNQKGLVQAVKEIFPHVCHRLCTRHRFTHFKQKFGSGIEISRDYWSACRATSCYEFKEAMKSMMEHNKEAAEWMLKTPVAQWSRHAFQHGSKSEHITNNMAECFNSWVGKFRSLPISKLIDNIRIKLMNRMHQRYGKGCEWKEKVTPQTRATLNKTAQEARFCRLVPSSNEEFEVIQGDSRFAVNIQNKYCSCGWWSCSGLPCKHAVLCISYKRYEMEDFCHDFYSVNMYLKAHAEIIHPLPQCNLQAELEIDKFKPPQKRRLPGRPRKHRRKDPEEESQSKKRKRTSTVRCHNCKQQGHNKRSCQRAPTKTNSSQKKTRTEQ